MYRESLIGVKRVDMLKFFQNIKPHFQSFFLVERNISFRKIIKMKSSFLGVQQQRNTILTYTYQLEAFIIQYVIGSITCDKFLQNRESKLIFT